MFGLSLHPRDTYVGFDFSMGLAALDSCGIMVRKAGIVDDAKTLLLCDTCHWHKVIVPWDRLGIEQFPLSRRCIARIAGSELA